MTTAKIKLTSYQAFIASGSTISDPTTDSGYQPALVRELARIVPGGGTVTLDAEGFRDLAEFANDLAGAEAQSPNPSGARSLYGLAEKCSTLARKLEASA